MIIDKLLPSKPYWRWFIHRALNRLTLRKTEKYSGQLWLGAFENWDEMESYLQGSPWTMQNKDELPPFPGDFLVVPKTWVNKKTFGCPLTQSDLERHRFIVNFCLPLDSQIKILDVGGGFNSCYFPICKTKINAENSLICDVVELSGICDKATSLYSHEPRLNYYKHFPPKKSYDLIYFGSSIQYFFDLDFLLKEISNYGSTFIIFSNSPIALKSDSFLSVPIKNERILFANIVHSINALKEKVTQYGYRLTFAEKNNSSQLMPYEWMFPEDVYCYDIVLQKI